MSKTQKEMALELTDLLNDSTGGAPVTYMDILDSLASSDLVLAPRPWDANPAAEAYMDEVRGAVARSAPEPGHHAI